MVVTSRIYLFLIFGLVLVSGSTGGGGSSAVIIIPYAASGLLRNISRMETAFTPPSRDWRKPRLRGKPAQAGSNRTTSCVSWCTSPCMRRDCRGETATMQIHYLFLSDGLVVASVDAPILCSELSC